MSAWQWLGRTETNRKVLAKDEAPAGGTPGEIVLHGIAWLILGGLFILVIFSFASAGVTDGITRMIGGLCIAGAASLVGALLGFLFGIPRTLQGDAEATSRQNPSSADSVGGAARQNPAYRPNTNLEQISDWLTKILVGVGLTKLSTLPARFQQLAQYLAPGFGTTNPEVIAVSVVLYFSIAGFSFGYLWTRLYLAAAFYDADVISLGKKISELEQKIARDARALGLVQQHLDASDEVPPANEKELIGAIVNASRAAKVTIFNLARNVRSNNWASVKGKERMERTIPIFQALIKSDRDNEFHMNHGQLGFALKDKREPDYIQAIAELTEAIRIRNEWDIGQWALYELARAQCRIALEITGSVDENAKEEIINDLKVAIKNDFVYEIIRNEKSIVAWLNGQRLSVDKLM